MKLPDFEAWAIFASVVEHRSFSGAAAAIGFSKATVSKAITRLEARLATQLFHRTSRRLSLTASGAVLAERARAILADGEAAEEAARDAAHAPTGLIRIAAPMSFGLMYLGPALAEFLCDHPGIAVDVRLSDARVDIVAEGIDIALRIADLPDSSLRARRIAPIAMHVVAAPAYLDRHGRPTHPGQLGEHDCVAYTNAAPMWRFRGPGGAEAVVQAEGRLRANSGDVMLPALCAGLGIGILPGFIVDRAIAAGQLETILTDWAPPPVALHLVTPPGTLRPARVEALIAFLAERFRDLCATRTINHLAAARVQAI